jgi:DNA repair protein RecN (Recombination protein N)
MLIGLGIRDVVLIERLDLAIGPGLTALTGETGAGKSIILDALGLATGARADAGLVRRGAQQASATALFAPAEPHPVWSFLDERGLSHEPGEDLVLRRQLSADGRSRAYVNDQPTSVGVLRELGTLLLEVHGQHETVGLLDSRTHRPLLDAFGGLGGRVAATRSAWAAWREAAEAADALRRKTARAAADVEELTARLAELDRLSPREGEELALASERALLSSAEKALADIEAAREAVAGSGLSSRLAQGLRALERARERAIAAGAAADGAAVVRLSEAAAAFDRALVEADEALSAVEAAAQAFDFEPDRLEKAEERLFALRAAARKLGVTVDALPAARAETAQALRAVESADDALRAAEADAARAEAAYQAAAVALRADRRAAAARLAEAVGGELPPLKLEKARFEAAVEPLAPERAGPEGADRVEFRISTNPGADFGPLGSIASGGELARLSLALKAALAARNASSGAEGAATPVMIFDEVDQGVGGAVADAVGLRLRRLAERGQVLVVTHSPQIAARADAHWRVSKSGADRIATAVETLAPSAREEEIARMLAGAEITDAARAAARALIGA